MNSIVGSLPRACGSGALGEAARRQFLDAAEQKEFPDGAVLASQGTPTEALPLVLTGRVLLLRRFDGQDVPVGEAGPGALLGLEGICGTGRHAVTARALGLVRAALVPRAAFLDRITTDPEAALVAFTVLAGRLRACIASTDELKFRDATARVARYLLDHRDPAVQAVRLPFSKKVFAAHLGITQQSLSRVLRGLRGVGVTVRGNLFLIADAERLAVLAAAEDTP